jgi:hypothetical protein
MAETRALIVIDDSLPQDAPLMKLAKLVGRRRRFRLCVVSVLPPWRSELLEHGGSGDLTKEMKVVVPR